MNKGWIYAIIFSILFGMAIIWGLILVKDSNKTLKEAKQNELESNMVVREQPQNIIVNEVSIRVNSNEPKTTPNTSIVLKSYYTECGHAIRQYQELPKNLVNATKEEIQQAYPNWEIEEFNPTKVILKKEKEGVCEEHYVLREKENKIVVYKLDSEGKEVEEKVTNISSEYLTQTDILKLQEGIFVYGQENVNRMLEDYE